MKQFDNSQESVSLLHPFTFLFQIILLSLFLLYPHGLSGQCGGEGQRPCRVWEGFPSCNEGLVQDFYTGKCVKPANATSVGQVVGDAVDKVTSIGAEEREVAKRRMNDWLGPILMQDPHSRSDQEIINRSQNTRNWMDRQKRWLQFMTLREIIWPGSHDAGTGRPTIPMQQVRDRPGTKPWTQLHTAAISLPVFTDPATNPATQHALLSWGQTQRHSIYAQLHAGARWFDIRLYYLDGTSYTSHWFLGESMDLILDGILRFLEENPNEIIILAERQRTNYTASQYEAYFGELKARLKEKLAPKWYDLSTTYGSLIRTPYRVIYSSCFEGTADPPCQDFGFSERYQWPAASMSDGGWLNIDESTKLADFQPTFNGKLKKGAYIFDQGQNAALAFSPSGDGYIDFLVNFYLNNGRPSNLKDMSEILEPYIPAWLHDAYDDPVYRSGMNVISLDFIADQPEVVGKMIELNKRRSWPSNLGRLESAAPPGGQVLYVEHSNKISLGNPALNRVLRDGRFRAVPGLFNPMDDNYTSLEFYLRPGEYLCQEANALVVRKRRDGESYARAATFRIIPGLMGQGQSLESVAAPGQYLRMRNGQAFMEAIDEEDENFRRDATFAFRQDAPYHMKCRLQSMRQQDKALAIDEDKKPVLLPFSWTHKPEIDFEVRQSPVEESFNPVFVQIESRRYLGYVLYPEEDGSISLRKKRNSDMAFTEASTFIVKAGRGGAGLSFESFRFPGKYLRQQDSSIRIDSPGEPNFDQDATWGMEGIPGVE